MNYLTREGGGFTPVNSCRTIVKQSASQTLIIAIYVFCLAGYLVDYVYVGLSSDSLSHERVNTLKVTCLIMVILIYEGFHR